MYFKGKGTIKINEQIIDLEKVGNVVALPVEDINSISFSNIYKVTTIENLTRDFFQLLATPIKKPNIRSPIRITDIAVIVVILVLLVW